MTRRSNTRLPLALSRTRLPPALSVGDSDPPLIEDHQIYDLVGVQKRRLFRRDAR
ncbi:hypothetical protein H6H01_23445 [Nostoc calcicola FACHB-3891]|nr:hypothetical protein [Nostoc calcicola FACHB-3891]